MFIFIDFYLHLKWIIYQGCAVLDGAVEAPVQPDGVRGPGVLVGLAHPRHLPGKQVQRIRPDPGHQHQSGEFTINY